MAPEPSVTLLIFDTLFTGPHAKDDGAETQQKPNIISTKHSYKALNPVAATLHNDPLSCMVKAGLLLILERLESEISARVVYYVGLSS